MTSGSRTPESTVEGAVFEVERFEWTADDRIELTGVWSGLRGSRFMRPTLVLTVDGEPRRLLALLDHKPWSAEAGEDWTAAFAWAGEPVDVEKAELNVASGVDLELPPPRRSAGKKAPRRFKHRAVAHDATRVAEPVAKPAEPKPAKPKPARAQTAPKSKPAKPKAETAAKPKAEKPQAEKPQAEKPKAETAATPEPEAAHPELATALERAAAAELRVAQLEKERDDAVARRKQLSADLTAATEAHVEAVRTARAEERESASQVLAEGAELRAAVERQREMAYSARDQAQRERDEAVAAKEQALVERKLALTERKEAVRDRDQALVDRDHAHRERDRAFEARDAALSESRRANDERDNALNERDTIVSVHKRGLPVVPPQPRHLPAEHERSDVEVWAPRVAAATAIAIFLVIVLRLVAGL